MTVAVVVKGYPRLSETFIAQEVLGLERRGIDIAIVSLRHPTDSAAHPAHGEIAAPVRYLPEYLHDEPVRVLARWREARQLPGFARAWDAFAADLNRDPTRNRVRRFGQACVAAVEIDASVDRLHAHFLHTPASVARYAALMRDLPFSLSGHAKDVWTTPAWELREKLADAAWTVTCSAAAAARLAAVAPAHPPALLYHGLDLARFTPAPDRPAARDGTTAGDPARLVTVCRAVGKKGLDTLLDALARLPRDLAWRLTHIGAGPDLPSLKRRAARHGIAARIDWRGAQPQAAVLAALREADLFVLAPRIAANGDRDGLPNVLLEAQSQGLAVAATTVSGIPELIVDGKTGLLTAPEDAAALAQAIARLIGDPALRRAFGAAGAARIRCRFDAGPFLDRLAERFRAPCSARRPAEAA